MARGTKDRVVDKGVSLARFPALLLGTGLLAFGLWQLLHNNMHPTGGFPDADVNGTKFLGFEGNGWSWIATAAGGGLLLIGAAQHHLAKTMSLIVGLALGAMSVIALVDKRDVLGMAAANGPTKLLWGAAAAFLLINTLLPRKGGHKDDVAEDRVVERPVAPRRPAPAPARAERVETEPPVRTERVETRPVHTERVEVDRADDGVRVDPELRDGRLDDRSSGRQDGSVAADDVTRDDRRL